MAQTTLYRDGHLIEHLERATAAIATAEKVVDKNFKTALANLTNDQIKGYLREGRIDINGNEVTSGMLKVVK